MVLELPAPYLLSLSLIAIIIGLIILAKPQVLSYLVAAYLLLTGVAGLIVLFMAEY